MKKCIIIIPLFRRIENEFMCLRMRSPRRSSDCRWIIEIDSHYKDKETILSYLFKHNISVCIYVCMNLQFSFLNLV